MAQTKTSASAVRLQRLTQDICTRLRSKEVVGSRQVAKETIVFFMAAIEIVADDANAWTTFPDFVAQINHLGRKLQEAGPKELVIGNIVRRIVKFIKEEYSAAFTASLEEGQPSVAESDSSYNRDANPLRGPDVFAHAVTANPVRPSSQAGSHQNSPHRRIPHSSTSFSSTTGSAPGSSLLQHKPSFTSGASSPNASLLSASSAVTLAAAPSMFDLLGHRSTMPSTLASAAPALDDDNMSSSASQRGTKSPSPPAGAAGSRPDMLSQGEQLAEEEFSRSAYKLRKLFTEAVKELLEEVNSAQGEIAAQALEHINAQEMILTLGHSSTVERFLKQAALKRKFTVIVAETAPSLSGAQHAKALKKAGIDTILVPDSNIFALMSRVTKVVLGAHAVLADGSFFTTNGGLAVSQVAKAHLVPVIVCTGLYKLCPIYLADDDAMLDEGNPLQVLDERNDPDTALLRDAESAGEVDVRNPFYDKVPSDLVSLFVTNAGGHPSSICYRLLTDLFGQ